MLLCEMPVEQRESQKAWYNNRNKEQNESISGELDALGQNNGQPIYQDRKSEVSRGRSVSVMND